MQIIQVKKYNVKAISSEITPFKPTRNKNTSKNKSSLDVAGRDILYRAIKMIMDNIGILERSLFFKDIKLENYEIANQYNLGWAFGLFNEINPYNTDSKFFGLIASMYLITGKAVIWLPKFGTDYPVQMLVLDERFLNPIAYDKNSNIIAYKYTLNNEQIIIPISEICTIVNNYPTENANTLYTEGYGSVTALKEVFENQYAQINKIKKYFEHDGISPYVISYPIGATPLDVGGKQFIRERLSELTGYQNDAIILSEGGQITPLTSSGREDVALANAILGDITPANLISTVLGIPKSLLTNEHTSFHDARDSRLIFIKDTCEPIAWHINETLQKYLRQFNENLTIEHTPYNYGDAEELRKNELHLLSTGQVTINDLRLKNGYDKIEGGDILVIESKLKPLTSQENVTPTLNSFDITKKKSIDNEWLLIDNFTKSLEGNLKTNLIDFYTEIENDFLDNLNLKFKYKFDKNKWKRNLINKLNSPLTDITTKVINKFKNDLDIISDKQNINDIIKKGVENSTNLITSNGLDTIEGDLKELLADNATATESDLKEIIKNKFKQIKTSRVDTIARTTSNNNYHFVQDITLKNLVPNKYKRKWSSENDETTRPSHLTANGQFENSQGLFEVGGELLPYPTGGAIASNNINCRCVLLIRPI
jgi:hypothetical protein